jgi:hypothetical protein
MISTIISYLKIKAKYVHSYSHKLWWPGSCFISFPMEGQFSPIISEAINRIMQPQGGVGKIKELIRTDRKGDGQKRFVVFNLAGSPIIIIAISLPKYPELLRVAAECALQAHARLGASVPAPLDMGVSDGVYFVITRYYHPRNRWEIYRQSGQVLTWLSEATRRTVVDPLPEEIEREFVLPLYALSQHNELQQTERDGVQEALSELKSGSWRPRLVLMHNDLHRGNILKASELDMHDWPFVIIDWGGLRLAGHGINDLIQLARDLKLPPAELASQLKIHCELLKCNPLQLRYYLLCAFGFFLLNPSFCPFDKLDETLQISLAYLDLSVAKTMEMNA